VFSVVMVLTGMLTFYAVWKSRRLSEFLDALADDQVTLWAKCLAFFRIWGR
jgi:hypothetical protein